MLGLVLKCHVCAAFVADVKAAQGVLFWIAQQYQRLVKVLADQGYRGDLETDLEAVYDVLRSCGGASWQRFPSATKALDRRTHLGMARKCTSLKPRLRTVAGES